LQLVGTLPGKLPFVATIDTSSAARAWSVEAATGALGSEAIAIGAREGATAIVGALAGGFSSFGDQAVVSADSDALAARLGATNRFDHAYPAGGNGKDGGNGVAIDKQGNLYVVGWFSQTAKFGDTTLTSAGDYDGFVWKIPAPEP
jgi:hypothetical protein